METAQSSNKASIKVVIAASLLFIFAVTSIVLAYKSLTAPADPSEFGALKNIATALFGLLAIVISLLLILSSIFLFMVKKWAYILSLVLIPMCMLVLGAGSINALIFEISGGAPLSVTSEILPVIVLISLLFCFKDFRKRN